MYVQNSFGDSGETGGYRRFQEGLPSWGAPARPELVRSVKSERAELQPRPMAVSNEGDGQAPVTRKASHHRPDNAGCPGDTTHLECL